MAEADPRAVTYIQNQLKTKSPEEIRREFEDKYKQGIEAANPELYSQYLTPQTKTAFSTEAPEYQQKVQRGKELYRGESEHPIDPHPFEDPVRLALLFGIPGWAGTGAAAKMATGAIFNTGYEIADKRLNEGRWPTPKELIVSGVLGGGTAGMFHVAGKGVQAGWQALFKKGVDQIADASQKPAEEVIKDIVQTARTEDKPINQVIASKMKNLGIGPEEFNKMWEDVAQNTLPKSESRAVFRLTPQERMQFQSAEGIKKAYFNFGQGRTKVGPLGKPKSSVRSTEWVSSEKPVINLKHIQATPEAKELIGEASKAIGRQPVRKFRSIIEEAQRTPPLTIQQVKAIQNPIALDDVQRYKVREALVNHAEYLDRLKKDPNAPQEMIDQGLMDMLEGVGKSQEFISEHARATGQMNIDVAASAFGSSNKIFTQDMVDIARENLRKRAGRMRTGIDPNDIKDLVKVGGYYIEGGIRDFAQWSEKMVADFGENIRPHLQNIYRQAKALAGGVGDESIISKQSDDLLTGMKQELASDSLRKEKIKAFNQLLKSSKAVDKEWLLNQARVIYDSSSAHDVNEVLQNAITSPIKKIQNAIEAAVVNGYLSNPVTWAAVHSSQGAYTLERPLLQRPIASIVDMITSAARGTPRERFMSDALVDIQAMNEALPEAASYFGKSFSSQRQVFTEDVMGRQFFPRASFGESNLGKKVSKVVHFPGGSMIGPGDDAVKVLNYRGSLRVQASQKALQAGLEGEKYLAKVQELVNNPTSDMIKSASKESFDKAFQRELSRFSGKFAEMVHTVPVLGRVIVPFITVADSGLRAVYERSPAAFPELGYKFAKGLISQGEFADGVAKMIIGSIMMGGAYNLAQNSRITGSAPLNAKDGAVWYEKGLKPYHVYFGDTGVGYGRFEPFATLIGTVADFHSMRDYADQTDGAFKIAKYALQRNLLNKTYLSGFSDFLNSLLDPHSSAENWDKQIAGAAIPQISYGAARTVDPVLRDPRNLGEAFKKRIPWLSQEVPPVRGIWGQPVMDLRNPVAKMIDPMVITKMNNDPVTQGVFEAHARITSPSDMTGEIPLTLEEHELLLERKGAVSHKRIGEWMRTPEYRAWRQAKQFVLIRKKIEKIDQDVNRDARKWIEKKVRGRIAGQGYTEKQYKGMKKGYYPVTESLMKQGR